MQFTLNGESKNINAPEITISDMLRQEWDEIPNGIAIAVGEQIIPRSQWESHCIAENQHVLVITATQGG